MSKRFYAVQVGDDYSSDYGSTVKREALRMARAEAKENPLQQVRVVVLVQDEFDSEIIVQNGAETLDELKRLRAYKNQYFALLYHDRNNFNYAPDMIRDWGGATLYRFPTKAELDEYVKSNPLAMECSFDDMLTITGYGKYDVPTPPAEDGEEDDQ